MPAPTPAMPPQTPPGAGPVQRVLDVASHLAIPLGLYFIGAVVALAQVAGLLQAGRSIPARGAWVPALACSFCVGVSVYLLDRAKLSDARLDPADALASPSRAGFIRAHARALRVAIVALALLACALGALVSWVLVPIVAASYGAVVVYAGRPRRGRPRPKDALVWKNVLISAGITGFSAALVASVVGMWEHDVARSGVDWSAIGLAIVHVFVRVLADSIVCDLEDAPADEAFGTRTLATALGASRAWNIATGIRLALGAVLVLAPIGPWRARVPWGIVTIGSTVLMRVLRPRRLRDATDLRLPAEAALVWTVLALL